MQAVIDLARLNGWLVYHPFDSRRSAKGYFDLTMMQDGYVIFSELKTENGRATAYQKRWGDEAKAIEQNVKLVYQFSIEEFITPVRYFFWRPSDWPEIEQVLQRPTE